MIHSQRFQIQVKDVRGLLLVKDICVYMYLCTTMFKKRYKYERDITGT